jgi:hypothetical protein
LDLGLNAWAYGQAAYADMRAAAEA